MGSVILEADCVTCSLPPGGQEDIPLRDVSLALSEGAFTLIHGGEGSGRGQLVRLLALLDRPERGEIRWRGSATSGLAEGERAAVRNQYVGLVFAAPFLLPSFSIVENVAMPMLKIANAEPLEAHQRTTWLLDRVGLAGREELEMDALSEEEQFRAALARALVNRPEILVVERIDIGDSWAAAFVDLVAGIHRELKLTVLAAAADARLAAPADRVIEMRRGRIWGDSAPVTTGGGAKA